MVDQPPASKFNNLKSEIIICACAVQLVHADSLPSTFKGLSTREASRVDKPLLMFLNVCVVLESGQKKLFGWQIIHVETPDITFSSFFRVRIEPRLPTVSETSQYSIKSSYVGKTKEDFDKVCQIALYSSSSLSYLSFAG